MSSSSVGISSSSFAKSSGELIGLVNELRASGASLVLDVPRIVVIGNQSAGKSSLVEAISGVSSYNFSFREWGLMLSW